MAADSFVVGLDCGTSYLKAAALTTDGRILAHARLRSPLGRIHLNLGDNLLFKTSEWWSKLKKLIQILISNETLKTRQLTGICVSGITPTLTIFDPTDPDVAYSIPYWQVPSNISGKEIPETPPQEWKKTVTRERVRILSRVAEAQHMRNPYVTDLVGYINWRLTGVLTINSIALVELGLSCDSDDPPEIPILGRGSLRCVAPVDRIGEVYPQALKELGLPSGISVCGGCSDTVATIVGAGLEVEGDLMIYLGTFGSLLRLDLSVEQILRSSSLPALPYTWLLSVPRFGPTIERIANSFFKRFPKDNRLQLLDQAAKGAPPGADGTLLLLPRWDGKMKEHGKFRFVPNGVSDLELLSRSALESIGYAIRIVMLQNQGKGPIWASGGGSQSRIWIQSLAHVIRREILVKEYAWEAVGTCAIAIVSLAASSPDRLRVFRATPSALRYVKTIEMNAKLFGDLHDKFSP